MHPLSFFLVSYRVCALKQSGNEGITDFLFMVLGIQDCTLWTTTYVCPPQLLGICRFTPFLMHSVLLQSPGQDLRWNSDQHTISLPLSSATSWVKMKWWSLVRTSKANQRTRAMIRKNDYPTFAATWTELEEIMLSAISQAEKDNYHMVSLICRT